MLVIRRVPTVLQRYTYDCGVSSLLAILRYYGGDAPREWLIEKSGTTSSGVSFYGLSQAGTLLGFSVEGCKGDLCSFPFSTFPLIAHLKKEEQEHFVVVEKVTKNFVFLMDPASGHSKVKIEEYQTLATENYLCFHKTGYLKTIELKACCQHFFRTFFWRQRLSLIFFGLLGFCSFFIELMILFHFKLFVNYAVLAQSIQNVLWIGVVFLLLNLLKIGFSFFLDLYQEKLEQQLSSFFEKQLGNTLLTLPYLFYKTRSSGSILTFKEELSLLCSFPITFLKSLFVLLPLFLFFLFYFYFLSSFYFWLLCFGLLAFFLITWFEKKHYSLKWKENHALRTQQNDFSLRMFQEMEMIKGLHLERHYLKSYQKGSNSFHDSDYGLHLKEIRQKNLFQGIEKLLYFTLLMLGGIHVIEQKYRFSTFLLLESFLGISLQVGSSFLFLWFQYSPYKKAREHFDELFSLKKELLLPHTSLKVEMDPEITLSHLKYSYGDTLALKDINIHIKAGSHVFLYGKSGSGKSTLGKILGGFYAIPFGMVRIGSVDLMHYNLDYLREEITYYSFLDSLSSGTLYDNLTLGRKVLFSEIEEVLKITGFDLVLKRKKITLQTDLSQLGSDLSAGEKSRLLLARALLKKSKIYIFDECFQHLDKESERRILLAIFRKYPHATILSISHRFTCKDLFSQVLYLKDGVCYEEVS